jgi:hypothetical protein
MASPRIRTLTALLLLSLVGALASPPSSPAEAGSLAEASSLATASAKQRVAKRKGGKVRKAWPAKGVRGTARRKAPRKALSRFLAKQVGPKAVKRSKRPMRARTSAAGPVLDFLPGDGKTNLRLVRSFDVPAGDPAAERMTNLSWTYDSAVAAVALMNAGEKAQAEQLLDQLAALQRTDGSIDYAFNVQDGSSLQLFNTGAIAWTGVAAAMYRSAYRSSRYDGLAGGAARWLLARRLPSGLLAGGPTVSWASTQHNIIAWYFLMLVSDRMPSGLDAKAVIATRDGMAAAIKRDLLVTVDGSRMAFNQGAGDAMRPLDVQTLGAMFLAYDGALGRNPQAGAQMAKVLNYLYTAFPVSGRSIVKSTDPATFNDTWEAKGPFSGFRPYAEGGPDVLWAEGTAQVRFMQRVLGLSSYSLDRAISAWGEVSSKHGYGPLGADRAETSEVNEYHVWPTSAAASWTLMGATGSIHTPFNR